MKENIDKLLILVAGGVLAIAGSISTFLFNQVTPDFGSVNRANEYHATSTADNTLYGATITGSTLIQTGVGTLGSMVITGANTGVVNFYNATTSDVNLRTGQKATSTILIASIPASTAAGTYTFDAIFIDGLYIDLESGNMPTSTVTYRQ